MPEIKDTKKYTFTVEGETEKWYFDWLEEQINQCETAKCKASIIAKVQQNPSKFAKTQAASATPTITHICDVESNEPVHVQKFKDILDRLSEANKVKKIQYGLGYSNFTFELWISLHKVNCNGPLSHRTQYLTYINKAFDENFEDLQHYKKKDNFKCCLSKLTLDDVKSAIKRSQTIMNNNASDPGKRLIKYKKFEYYPDNPSLTIWESVKKILDECGV